MNLTSSQVNRINCFCVAYPTMQQPSQSENSNNCNKNQPQSFLTKFIDKSIATMEPKRIETALRLGVGAFFQPFQCAHILIQLGHEPLPLERGKAYMLFGSDAYFLPNIFKYLGEIKRRHGWSGIYTGVGSAICCNFVGFTSSMVALSHLEEKYPDPIVTKEVLASETTGQAVVRLIRKLQKQTVSKAIGVIVARPFQVIMVRRVAQLVGGESIYLTTFGSMKTILNEEGFKGLFSGLVPQLVGELGILWVSSSLLFAFDRLYSQYFKEEEENEQGGSGSDDDHVLEKHLAKTWKSTAHHIIPYFVKGLFYPFQLISTIMAVNGTPLKVGTWPYMPIFLHWQDCWDYLAKDNQLKRGSKLFLRHYVGPVDFKDGQIHARAIHKKLA